MGPVQCHSHGSERLSGWSVEPAVLVAVASPVVEVVVEANLAEAVGQANPVGEVAVVAKAEVEVVAEVVVPVPAEVVLAQHSDRAGAERAPQVWAGPLFSLPQVKR